jgi:carboxypeptidase Taq
VSGLATSLEAADYAPLRGWLTDTLYRHGWAYTPEELLRRSTGEGLNAGPLVAYLRGKYEELYA